MSASEQRRRQAIRDAYAAGIPLKVISAEHKVHKSGIYHYCHDLPRRMEPFADRIHKYAIRFTAAELAELNRARGKLPLATYLRKRIFPS